MITHFSFLYDFRMSGPPLRDTQIIVFGQKFDKWPQQEQLGYYSRKLEQNRIAGAVTDVLYPVGHDFPPTARHWCKDIKKGSLSHLHNQYM